MTKAQSWLPEKLRPMRSPFRRYYDEIAVEGSAHGRGGGAAVHPAGAAVTLPTIPGLEVWRNGRCLWRVVEYAGGLAWLWVGVDSRP